jgi:hypothetical protein
LAFALFLSKTEDCARKVEAMKIVIILALLALSSCQAYRDLRDAYPRMVAND